MTATDGDTIELYLSHIELCISTKDLKFGRLLHSRLLKTALHLHTILSNRLIDMYAKCGSLPCSISSFDDLPFKNHQSWNTLLAAFSRDFRFLDSARQLFDEMPERNIVSYNTMISKLSHHGKHHEALKLFSEMQRKGIGMDKFTVVGIAPACTGLAHLHSLRQLHGAITSNGLQLNSIMSNVLIDGYGKCGHPNAARQVFDIMPVKDIVSWTSLITAYTNANRLEDAYRVFLSAPSRTAVSWTALISGFEQNMQEEVAVNLFEQMFEEGIRPTPFTSVSLLSACARLGLIDRGKQLHCYMLRRFIDFFCFNIFTQNSLIDLYAKCGDMESATVVFDRMPARDVISWNSMVTGFAQNGLATEAFDVFKRMLRVGIKPSHVTFLGVLSACSHGGLVTESRQVLRLMEKEFEVFPGDEHYSALIDGLGRMRRLEEAMKVIESLESDGRSGSVGMWGALLGACRAHGNMELGRRAAESLFVLEPENGARYVTLSNIYAAAGQWDEAGKVRVVMKGRGLRKEAGCSWIEVKGGRKVFVCEDKSHLQTREIYEMVLALVDRMKGEEEFAEGEFFI
ncbi:pentatricopeptide repeat-containing protein At2g13600-like [Phalaenopsis equestris]|uniref:pentatricopeptide repeat-containing protein At2g13600-like n=1 Tax=Phalaenopsis equestris TaxID=78828 RepID=UPI0009E4CBAA|nr:pentatricopeptide repeat-containing protein At2g13600-like [Phalaenopsis equestris]